MEQKKQLLIDRLNANLADYHAQLLGFTNREIIDMAARAAAMSDVHGYLVNYNFDDTQLDYLLMFQNPLEIITDAWEIRLRDISDLDFTIHSVCDRQDAAQSGYAHFGDAIPEPGGPEKAARLLRDELLLINGKRILADKLFPLAEPSTIEKKKHASVRARLAAASKAVKVHPVTDEDTSQKKKPGMEK